MLPTPIESVTPSMKGRIAFRNGIALFVAIRTDPALVLTPRRPRPPTVVRDVVGAYIEEESR